MTASDIPSALRIQSPHPGKATFVRHGLFWNVTMECDGIPPIYGLAMIVGNRLAIAFGPLDKVEIGAYTLAGDRGNSLWVPPAAKGGSLSICGREKLKLESEGKWNIEEAVAIDNSTYSGFITVAPRVAPKNDTPGIVDMTWNLNDGVFSSFALQYPDMLLSCWNLGPKETFGIAGFALSGDQWTGHSVAEGMSEIIQHQWTRA